MLMNILTKKSKNIIHLQVYKKNKKTKTFLN